MDDGLGIILLVILVIGLFALIGVIASIVTLWQLFDKAGKPGWASIVPVYNLMIMAEIGNRPAWAGVFTGVMSVIVYIMPRDSSVSGNSSLGLYFVLLALNLAISILFLGFYLYLIIGCMRKYDKGVMIWLLYVFLPFIAVFLVGKVKYIGNGIPTESSLSNVSAAPVIPTDTMAQMQATQATNFANIQQPQSFAPVPEATSVPQPPKEQLDTPVQESTTMQPQQPNDPQNQ